MNPFSTRHIKPGAIAYRFPPGESAQSLVERLRANDWWGQITGAHGSGKSTLLAALAPLIEASGKKLVLFELHDGQRKLPVALKSLADLAEHGVVAVDGYEQLARWNRYRLKDFCRSNKLGLVVTSHKPVGLPDLFHTQTTLDLAQALVEQLLDGEEPLLTTDDLNQRFATHGGDLRELLFDLYDVYEQRQTGLV